VSSKPGFAAQLLFAVGVVVVVVAVVAHLMGDFSGRYAAGTVVIGLVIALVGWRSMRR